MQWIPSNRIMVSEHPSTAARLSHGWVSRRTYDIFTCCHTETEQGKHDLYLSWSQHTNANPSKERVPETVIGPMTS